MTIAIALKVGDGVVLGADSASTLSNETGVVNVYFNAEKGFNLYKGMPIGAVTYGLGNLAQRSVTYLAKDLRERLGGEDPQWKLQPYAYTIEQVAGAVRRYFYEELYLAEWPKKAFDAPGGKEIEVFAAMGFIVAGYSAGKRHAEIWVVEIDEAGKCSVRELFGTAAFGIDARGMPEALARLMNGWSPRILTGLVRSGITEADALKFLQSQVMEPLVQPGMPIQDAIDLVRYLIDVTAGFVRFIPGAPTVHEPIDLAAITFHEGFRWVKRKHYYQAELNPPI